MSQSGADLVTLDALFEARQRLRSSGVLRPTPIDHSESLSKLAGRRILVTGAAGTFGRAMSARFTAQGAHVVGLDIARPDDSVIFTRNTTDATNLLARSLPEGTTTVVFDTEHHASLLPWGTAVRLGIPAFPGEAVRALKRRIARAVYQHLKLAEQRLRAGSPPAA